MEGGKLMVGSGRTSVGGEGLLELRSCFAK